MYLLSLSPNLTKMIENGLKIKKSLYIKQRGGWKPDG